MSPPRTLRRAVINTSSPGFFDGVGKPPLGATAARARRRILLAHDAQSPTCDALVEALGEALGEVEIAESSSADHAAALLARERWDACLVCLDLPPAPTAGVRLAELAVAARGRDAAPVVLVTRSLRWLPARATELHALAWVAPDASAADLAQALDAATRLAREHGHVPEPRESDVVLRDGVVVSRKRRAAR